MKQRTFRDDLIWAVAVLAGFAIGALIFDAEAAILIGAAIGAVLVIAVRAVLRARVRARRARS
jgi:hypothetical protein